MCDVAHFDVFLSLFTARRFASDGARLPVTTSGAVYWLVLPLIGRMCAAIQEMAASEAL